MKMSFSEYVPVFKAISDETRLRIIDLLSSQKLCACDLLEQFSISQSTLSYHMKILSDSGLVRGEKEGSWVRYALNQERMNEVMDFLAEITREKEYDIQSVCEPGNIRMESTQEKRS
ncbi:winged helix-turn-helix transcriptional regulator [Proteiniclasticum sp. SCR006]|uniref:Winged helix-turn-helix transcriptional regulator n=1 Tax=Proteiniclasticum aestuarii TaxID=2817862 RepID=A0A939HBI4_9CLOT|nr:metalloregulator ArsR/SmtB family transcription factor [Proteiniclasticum aestuarii]MBO1264907.1 winged helix-turn-helix transcriptional regulator [Proteiniclasticum aestuarii]